MADIRPTSLPVTPASAGAPARTPAQRAFFDAAMGRAGAPAPAEPVKAATPVAQRVVRESLPEEPPKKILRPGSLLDIRV